MSGHAIIQATYTDMKFVRTRKVVQLVFECPIEQAQHVMDAFGAPDESWYALAKLNGPGQRAASSDAVPQPPSAASEGQDRRRHFSDMQPSQQAALKTKDVNFQKFMHDRHGKLWQANRVERDLGVAQTSEQLEVTTDRVIKFLFDMQSKSELDRDPHKAKLWDSLLAEFEIWQRAAA